MLDIPETGSAVKGINDMTGTKRISLTGGTNMSKMVYNIFKLRNDSYDTDDILR